MPKLSPEALRTRIARLQKQLVAAEKAKGPAIRKVQALMKKLGVTVADLGGRAGTVKAGRPITKVAIKYRDRKGNTWTGRGKTPLWLVEAEKKGMKRDQFLV